MGMTHCILIRWANSALVVAVDPVDCQASLSSLSSDFHRGGTTGADPLVGIKWQRMIERKAAKLGGGNLVSTSVLT